MQVNGRSLVQIIIQFIFAQNEKKERMHGMEIFIKQKLLMAKHKSLKNFQKLLIQNIMKVTVFSGLKPYQISVEKYTTSAVITASLCIQKGTTKHAGRGNQSPDHIIIF